MAKGRPSDNLLDSRIICAVEAASAISKGEASADEVFAILKTQFNEQEISELIAYICFVTASQRFGAFLDLQPTCPL
jgi:alkylhydroperoxidase family enzyme